MFPFLLILLALALFGLAVILPLAARKQARIRPPLIEQVDAILPQTQCGQCGYPACRPYAEAITRGEADINQCPPGGQANIKRLARLLGRTPIPLNEHHGIHKPRAVALIEEGACIGCTLCIQACPVDAIAGAAKLMHTVIASECTGCELCLPPCPVNCISINPAPADTWHWTPIESPQRQARQRADTARQRYDARQQRLALERQRREARRALKQVGATKRSGHPVSRGDVIQAAIERVKAKKAAIRNAGRPAG